MLIGASYGTVGDIEIMWCFIALVGLGFSLYNVREAKRDYDALRITRTATNGKWVIASTTLWVEVIRVAIQLVFLSIGAVAMWLPQPHTDVQPLSFTVAGAIIQWGIIATSLLVTAQAVLTTRMREQLLYREPRQA